MAWAPLPPREVHNDDDEIGPWSGIQISAGDEVNSEGRHSYVFRSSGKCICGIGYSESF